MITNKSEAQFVPLGLKYDKNIPNNESLYASLLKEQNVHLTQYADFFVGGLTDNAMNHIISGKTVKENILSSPYVVDIHRTTMTDEKGIWTTETTKEKLLKAMEEVDD
eukprot:14155234-Ditylum_brightwellii.AAC.1